MKKSNRKRFGTFFLSLLLIFCLCAAPGNPAGTAPRARGWGWNALLAKTKRVVYCGTGPHPVRRRGGRRSGSGRRRRRLRAAHVLWQQPGL